MTPAAFLSSLLFSPYFRVVCSRVTRFENFHWTQYIVVIRVGKLMSRVNNSGFHSLSLSLFLRSLFGTFYDRFSNGSVSIDLLWAVKMWTRWLRQAELVILLLFLFVPLIELTRIVHRTVRFLSNNKVQYAINMPTKRV